ncbi:amidohydrolase family protein [Sphingosinicella rhizophila]|uniref:Amidohydrolase family protein n=1 Tax=Sphingosinicella rhizophila TaxID=3050082 RepID=A0ABU3QB98_9SPHN|nr:amidohydrolase family protein [Sphingosinicella sp. GR2756]MDT9600666.1 amidohydrolase family protein [Sphingosinicella sp. GR2756]
MKSTAAISLLLLTALASAPLAAQAPSFPPPLADHHMHINGEGVVNWMRRMAEKSPEDVAGMSEDIFRTRSGTDALRELDRAGIKQGVLLSAAYMFASPMLPTEDMAAKMRAENRYVVDAAKASGGRLVAFVGINPFAGNALEELSYWSRHGASGIKLHMGNSELDLASPDHVSKLASFFGAARVARLPIVIHLRGRADYTADGVRTFIDRILSQAGDLPVQIAHGGSYGGTDPVTLDAIRAYGDAIARKAPGTENLVIEISAVAQFDLSQGKDLKAHQDRVAQYVEEMRKIGMDRFVFGSDWPALSPPTEYFAAERTKLPITDAEWADIADNRAPYLLPAWTDGRAGRNAH